MNRRRKLRIDKVIIALAALIIVIITIFSLIKGIISLFDNDDIKDTNTINETIKDNNIDEDIFTVIIDPGHGGYDGGTVNGDLYEKDIVLKISKEVRQILEEKSFIDVVMTRETDKALGDNKDADLLNRAAFSSQYDADYFVSIHVNSFEDTSVKGIEIFKKDESSDSIAQYVMNELDNLGLTDNRGIFDHSGLMVLRKNSAKSILVETGYISGDDYYYLRDDEQLMKIAHAIANGIIKQIESDKK